MKIHDLSNSANSIYFKEEFIAFLEQHLNYIKNQGMTLITLTEINAYKHEGNFYGILNEFSIPVQYHYITMRINGLLNSNLYDGYEKNIYLPNFDIIEQLKNQYITTTK